MPRLPDKTSIQARTDFSTPAVHVADTSAAFKGVANLGNALQAEGRAITQEEHGLDLIKADADLDAQMRGLERKYDTDTDHGTYETRFGAESNQVVMDTAKGIRDPKMREKWLLSRGQAKQQASLDRVMNRGNRLAREEKEVEVGNILQGYQGAYAETDDPERRRQVLADMDAAIRVGERTGLLSPKTVERLRETYIDGAIASDADNRIFHGDSEGVMRDLGMMPGGSRQRRKVSYGAPDLGSVSAKYESGEGGVGFVSSGKGDPGGPSYGIHQLSSKDSMPAFLRSPEGKPYASKFARQVVGSPTFNATYREIARQDPEGFAKAQFDFYARTHYQPALEAAKAAGFDTSDRGVQEAIFSIGVQHGGARKVIEAAAGAGNDPQDQIRALYRERARYVAGLRDLPGRTKQSVLNRYKSEERDALRLAGTKAGDADDLGQAPGLVEKGNIDLGNRPVVRNDDGTISTVRSMSANFDGVEVLIPTVSDDGRILTEDEAVEQYRKTGKHLGKFKTPKDATAFAKRLHDQQEKDYSDKDDGTGLIPWGEATEIEEDSPTRAQYRMLSGKARSTLITKSRTALSAKTQMEINSDIERIERGEDEIADENGETAFQRGQRLLTANQKEKFAQRRDQAILMRDSVRGMRWMHEDAMPDHIASIGADAPAERRAIVEKVREKAYAEQKKILEARRTDPAAAVADHPRVEAARRLAEGAGYAGVSRGEDGELIIDAKLVPPLVAEHLARQEVYARLDAQEALGIEPHMQRRITKRQAQRLINLPDAALLNDEQLRVGLAKAAARAASVYGPELGQEVYNDALALAYRGGRQVEAHHSDYRKPLEILWGCRQHHRRLHAGDPIPLKGGVDHRLARIPKELAA